MGKKIKQQKETLAVDFEEEGNQEWEVEEKAPQQSIQKKTNAKNGFAQYSFYP